MWGDDNCRLSKVNSNVLKSVWRKYACKIWNMREAATLPTSEQEPIREVPMKHDRTNAKESLINGCFEAQHAVLHGQQRQPIDQDPEYASLDVSQDDRARLNKYNGAGSEFVPIHPLMLLSARSIASLISAKPRLSLSRPFSSNASRQLQLAFDLHEPPKDHSFSSSPSSPIVFVHGLFGSKKNNRSMSK